MTDWGPEAVREGWKPGAGRDPSRECQHSDTGGSTYFVTTLIFTPKTPVCFLEGVLFRLISRLVNFMENSTLIWFGVRQGMRG